MGSVKMMAQGHLSGLGHQKDDGGGCAKDRR